MTQLTLPDCAATRTLPAEIERSVRRWALEFGDGRHLAVAERATEARFSEWGTRALTHRECTRVRAYFDAVVRRALMHEREAGARSARQRLVEASIVADLRAAGWDEERATAEARMVTARSARGAAA